MKESYRIDELASRWRVDKRTIRRWIKSGALEAIKHDKTVRIPAEEIRRFEKEKSTRRPVAA